MIKLDMSLIWNGCADGKYFIKAKGFILAVLRWGSSNNSFSDWSPFAYVPVDPAGNGTFVFSGNRSIPQEVTHVWVRCYTSDFASFEDISAAIPKKYLPEKTQMEEVQRFSILTDLHFTLKPWKTRMALRAVRSDMLFLLGDLTNDGLPEQFDGFKACLEELAPAKTIFSVPGNHDILHPSRPNTDRGCENYAAFQSYLLARAEEKGYEISYAPDGRAYAVQIGNLEVIGLNCVTTGRRFLFPDGIEMDWLEKRLSASDAAWHVILCHAPLLKHNPNRNEGVPYLDKNKRLQEILDSNRRILFLSGHTHVSANVTTGNGEYDRQCQNIYLDCGSVVPTDTSGETGLMSPDWKDGCITEIAVTMNTVEICMRSIESGVQYPRGYYCFRVDANHPPIHPSALQRRIP